ncbi:trypsin-like serine protease [Luteolibacter ambystomatis]|uniref:Trypsin-like serine protease n=1 Tax=Luteolibacter ambystomatis TaxID=2824561 RepID=A0A975PGB1_9BACT|nr:trypsin-like serine protease [Luteolibacter ambystomatis]QUE52583.1 trypsin-like serine protease [Luteolibacter ambystomatis]
MRTPVLRLLIALAGFLPVTSSAVVIASGDGSGNITAPPDDPGFANIGTLNGASAVYLGNGWVMTAAHVAGSLPATVNFGGTNYSTQSGTFNRLNNHGTGGMTVDTDIVLFRLATDPGLATLNISASTPTVGSPVVMIGNGRDRAAGPTFWNVNTGTDPWTWTELPDSTGANEAGFKELGSQSIRWGTNAIDSVGVNADAGFGTVRSMVTVFNDPGTTHEAQAAVGDSGGAIFYKNGSNWELTGMFNAVGTFSGQPGNTAALGNATYIADLSFYRNDILTITGIPEPATTGLALIGAGLMLRRRR